jgi:bifunctional DNA-binding transcriptional regulator/antitoxin component of YhaV-PrlF toxin-antitoxin module
MKILKEYSLDDLFEEYDDTDELIHFNIPHEVKEYLDINEGDIVEPSPKDAKSFYIRKKGVDKALVFELVKDKVIVKII